MDTLRAVQNGGDEAEEDSRESESGSHQWGIGRGSKTKSWAGC